MPAELNEPGRAVAVTDGDLLAQAHALMHDERLSAGGNIRDKSLEDLSLLTQRGGSIWGWCENGELLSVLTAEPLSGWMYLNNGVTRPDARGRGINGELLSRVISLAPDMKFIVLYVRQGLFERLGFTEVTIDGLSESDPVIADSIRSKLRPGKEAHIFIRGQAGNGHVGSNKPIGYNSFP